MKGALQILDKTVSDVGWDKYLANRGGHVLQSSAWGALKGEFGWRFVQRIGLENGLAQVLYRALPGGLGSIAYVPKGPLIDYADEQAVRTLLYHIMGREQRTICLKIEPDLEDDPQLAGQLHALGFRPSPQTVQPRRTLLVDLDTNLDEILARMKSKTRYNIRLAGRKGVIIRHGTTADLPAVYRLMETTARRDGFGIHSQAYYEAVYRIFVRAGLGCLLLAEFEGQLLAALVALAFGDIAAYMYGASSEEERNRMPTYLLQWQAIRWAKEQGCRIYDLWGVPDADEETLEANFTERSDGLWGVYRFKRGFGGHLVRAVGAWDLVYAPLRYRLYTWAVRWLQRGQTGE